MSDHEETALARYSDELPSALTDFEQLAACLDSRKPALFLDYDGTLTPIVEKPEQAILSEAMHETLIRLAARCPVAVVSGRDLVDVRDKVGIESLFYSGSHGYDISGPEDRCLGRQQGMEFLPALDEAEQQLKSRLSAIDGARVERKRFAIAIHYRQVADDDIGRVETIVDETAEQFQQLKKNDGKKIFELQPDLDWHKGKAVEWLIEVLEFGDGVVPVFIGDDRTDEDAFKTLTDTGIGIVVTEENRLSAARFRLHDPEEVRQFFDRLLDRLG